MSGGRYKRGDTRADGMIFWAYQVGCRNGERWETPIKFKSMKDRAKQIDTDLKMRKRVAFGNHPRAHTKGDTREDGLVFCGYSITSKGFERWGTPELYNTEKDRTRSKQRERLRDPLYKFRVSIRNLISFSFAKGTFSKKSKTCGILGCTYDEFVLHITDQLTEGMTLSNHGKHGWHLDHKIPVSAATTEAEIIALNHYTNFQPMWAKENISKGDKHCPEELQTYLAAI